MNILIPTIGSRGDVQPFIALAQGLSRAGHNIKLASHPLMCQLVESHGISFASIGPDIDLAREVAAIRQNSRNPVMGLIRGMRFGMDMVEQVHDDVLTLCEDVDLVVISAQSAAGKNEADKLDLPYLSVNLMPWVIPWDDPARSLFQCVAYGLFDKIVGLITTRPLNRMRKRQGLPPVGKEGFTSKRLNLVPVSPAVFPHNPYWEEHHHIVGYWYSEMLSGWDPPLDLLAFLDEGNPPVVISLGTMSLGDTDAMETVNIFVDAVQQVYIRAIIQGWETELRKITLPVNIYHAGPIPHTWLLPRCTGVVHHGGFGTTAAGLQAGIPALVIPHIIDQFYWGEKVYELGVGPKPIRRKNLGSELLVNGLNALIRNEDIRTTAATLGELIRCEKGVDNAVHLIENTF